MKSLHRMGRPAPIEHRPNFSAPIADWPFRQTAKSQDDVWITNIGRKPDFSKCRRDKWCRGRCCRPRLNGGTR